MFIPDVCVCIVTFFFILLSFFFLLLLLYLADSYVTSSTFYRAGEC